jgi:recombination protein RecA
MTSAAALRIQIEHTLERRFPSALTPVARTIRETANTGIAAVDTLLEGGLPVGAISELVGPQSSGRTSLALSFLAHRTQDGQVAAWVDATDAFDPESAAANGVSLRQLLWVRCRNTNAAKGNGWVRGNAGARGKPWTQLEQAIQATDLLLQAGGFAAVVLDLAGTAPEHACRIPLATWFRFRQAADRTRCCLVVLGEQAYAQSSAALVVECAARQAKTAGETVLTGFSFEVRRERQRHMSQHQMSSVQGIRKPPASTWTAGCGWAQEERAWAIQA